MYPLIKSLSTAILILTLLSAGCTDTDDSPAGGYNPAGSPAAAETGTPTGTEASEPTHTATPEPADMWWSGDPDFVYGTHETSFFGDFDGIKNIESIQDGFYAIHDISSRDIIASHIEYTHFDPYDKLWPEQASELVDRYGRAELVVMEEADTDGDGALDRVAVKYVGRKGVLEFETEFIHRSLGIDTYLAEYLEQN